MHLQQCVCVCVCEKALIQRITNTTIVKLISRPNPQKQLFILEHVVCAYSNYNVYGIDEVIHQMTGSKINSVSCKIAMCHHFLYSLRYPGARLCTERVCACLCAFSSKLASCSYMLI